MGDRPDTSNDISHHRASAVRLLSREVRRYVPGRGRLAWVGVSAALASLCEAGMLILVTVAATSMAMGTATPSFQGVRMSRGEVLWGAAVLIVARLVLSWLNTRSVMAMAREGLLNARFRLMKAFTEASYERQVRQSPAQMHELLSARADLVGVSMTILGAVAVCATNLIVLSVTALVLQPIAVVGLIALAVASFGAIRPVARRTRQLSARYVALNDAYVRQLSDLTANIREVTAFGVGPRVVHDLDHGQQELGDMYRRARTVGMFGPSVYQSIAFGMAVAGLAIASATGRTNLTVLGAVVLLLLRGISYGQQLTSWMQSAEDKLPFVVSLTRAVEDLERHAAPSGTVEPNRIRSLELRGLSFRYAEGPPVLSGIDIDIAEGEMIGIVGPSGSGKTSLLHILAGLRRVERGQMLVNGTPFDDISAAWWHRQVAIVPQDAELFGGTLRRNVAFFRDVDDAAIARGVRLSQLETDVERIGGMDTVLSREGQSLSGGQIQRLAIARALAGDPQLILLDEPTSALDVDTERRLQRVLDDLRGSVTMVIVAHRLSTVASCDRVLVVDRGHLVADGPAEAVLAKYGEPGVADWGLITDPAPG